MGGKINIIEFLKASWNETDGCMTHPTWKMERKQQMSQSSFPLPNLPQSPVISKTAYQRCYDL